MDERISSTQCIIYRLCFSLYGLVTFIPCSANLYSLLNALCIFYFFSLSPLFFLTGGVDGMNLFFGYCIRPLILSFGNDFRLYTIQNVFSIPTYIRTRFSYKFYFILFALVHVCQVDSITSVVNKRARFLLHQE